MPRVVVLLARKYPSYVLQMVDFHWTSEFDLYCLFLLVLQLQKAL